MPASKNSATGLKSRAKLALAACVLMGAASACATVSNDLRVYYPERGPAARALYTPVFSQEITEPARAELRPFEVSTPAIDSERGLIYAGGTGGFLRAVSSSDGAIVWELDLGARITAQPVLADAHTLLVSHDDGALVAIDLNTRSQLWQRELGGRLHQPPTIHNGRAYISTSRDELMALDLTSGDWTWKFEREFSPEFNVFGHSGATLADVGEAQSVVYGGFDDGRIAALGADDGQTIWLASVVPPGAGEFSDADATPVVDAERAQLVVAGQASGVYGLDLATGAQRWSVAMRGASSIAAAGGGRFIVNSALEGVFALDSAGQILWRRRLDPGVPARAVVVDGTVFISHSESGLLAFDAASGDFLARLDPGGGISAPPVHDPALGRLYVVSNRGRLLALELLER